jgi:prephenate dehydrogenase
MQHVAIIGLGLIGGSIGMGLRRWAEANRAGGKVALEVVGFDSDITQQQHAQKIKAVDRAVWDLTKAVDGADLVVVATPVSAMRETFGLIAPRLRAGATVTDTGSTKADVLRWADEILPWTVAFVGGHPMAGKTQSIEGAEADLFKEATWCVAPSVRADEEAVRTVLGMVAALGAEAYFVDPTEHDAFVAGVSHLPFVISAALMRTVSADPSWRDMKGLTAGGFRDVSRLAAGSPAMHRDILLTNREAVTRWIDSFQETLGRLRVDLQRDPAEAEAALTAFFSEARDARAEWSTQTSREGELLQGTGAELTPDNFSDQMGRMLLGGFARRRRSASGSGNERPPSKPSNGA